MKESDFITNCFTCEKVFSPDECIKIISLFNTEIEHINHPSNSRFIFQNPENSWIFQKIGQMIELVNQKYYNFTLVKLNDYLEVFKYTENDYFSWKKDLGSGTKSIRKVSAMLFLSSQDQYQGGAIEWFNNTMYKISTVNLTNAQSQVLQQKQGNIIIYPSYLTYQMEQLTKGEKFTLITWALGTHFY